MLHKTNREERCRTNERFLSCVGSKVFVEINKARDTGSIGGVMESMAKKTVSCEVSSSTSLLSHRHKANLLEETVRRRLSHRDAVMFELKNEILTFEAVSEI